MNHLERTAAALEEINPPVAAALRRIGPSPAGFALPGRLGWLPPTQLVELLMACQVASQGTRHELSDLYLGLGEGMRSFGSWLVPHDDEREAADHEAVLAWSRLSGRVPLVDLLEVQAGKALS